MVNQENVGGVRMEAELDTGKFDAGVKKLDDGMKKLDPQMKRTEKGMKDVEQASHGAAQGADRMGMSFKQLFPSMTAANLASQAITRTLRGLKDTFVGAVKGAIDFEHSLVQIRKVTGATKREMQDLKGFIQDLAVQTGIAKSELADIAAGGGRLGIFAREGPAGLKAFTEVIAKSRIAMEDYALSSDEATDKTARLLNLFGLKSHEAEVLLSIMNELSNTAAATSSNIADNVINFASLSQSFGASKESLLALATTMEEVGSEPQAFSTALQRALFEMQANTDKFASFLGADLGPKFKETFAEKPIEAFAIFLTGLKQTQRDIGSTLEKLGIGDARLTRELAKLATDKGLERFAENLETATKASGEAQDAVEGVAGAASSLGREFERASDTTKRRLQSLGEQAGKAGVAFGDQLLPPLNSIIELLTEGIQSAIPYVEALGAVFGGLLSVVARTSEAVSDLLSKIPRAPILDSVPVIGPVLSVLGKLKKQEKMALSAIPSPSRSASTTSTPGTGEQFDVDVGSLGGEEAGRAAEKIEKAEKEVLKALADQAKLNMEILETRKDELELKQKIGTITERESRELARINNRLEFQKDKVKDLTDAWEDQGDVVQKIRDEIGNIEQDIKDINAEGDKRKADRVGELLREQREIREKATGSAGLTGDMSRRLGEIDAELAGVDPNILAKGEELDVPELQRIELETKQKLEEANARLAAKKRELVSAEMAETAALGDLQAAMVRMAETTQIAFAGQTEAVRIGVESQIANLRALEQQAYAAGRAFSSVGSATPDVPGFARGGPIVGPGGPTDDSVLIRASAGEAVVNARGYSRNRGIVDAINAGAVLRIPAFAQGGPVGSVDNSRSASITVHNHGHAAEVYADPRRARWDSRFYL